MGDYDWLILAVVAVVAAIPIGILAYRSRRPFLTMTAALLVGIGLGVCAFFLKSILLLVIGVAIAVGSLFLMQTHAETWAKKKDDDAD